MDVLSKWPEGCVFNRCCWQSSPFVSIDRSLHFSQSKPPCQPDTTRRATPTTPQPSLSLKRTAIIIPTLMARTITRALPLRGRAARQGSGTTCAPSVSPGSHVPFRCNHRFVNVECIWYLVSCKRTAVLCAILAFRITQHRLFRTMCTVPCGTFINVPNQQYGLCRNSDGSTYYNNGQGSATYTTPSGYRTSTSTRK